MTQCFQAVRRPRIVLLGVLGAMMGAGPVSAQEFLAWDAPAVPQGCPVAVDDRITDCAVQVQRAPLDWRRERTANAVLIEGGFVATSFHALDGIEAASINFGRFGAATPTQVVYADEARDVIVLKIEPPTGAPEGLTVRSSRPGPGEELTLVARDEFGAVQCRSGSFQRLEVFNESVGLSTDIPAWRRSSGAAVVDASGRVVGLQTRFTGGSKSACLTPASFLLGRFSEPVPWSEWLAGRLNPESRRRYRLLASARAYIRVERQRDALREFEAMLVSNPDDRGAISGVAVVLRPEGPGAFESWLDEHARVYPKARRPLIELGDACIRAGRFNLAVDSYTRALNLQETPSIYYWRARAYQNLPESDEQMLADYQRALDLDPEFEPAIIAIAEYARPRGHTRLAYQMLMRLRRLAPDDLSIARDAAVAAERVGKCEDVDQIIQDVRKRNEHVAQQIAILIDQVRSGVLLDGPIDAQGAPVSP
jgi:tetratricopeptide (TPR) repeat protein